MEVLDLPPGAAFYDEWLVAAVVKRRCCDLRDRQTPLPEPKLMPKKSSSTPKPAAAIPSPVPASPAPPVSRAAAPKPVKRAASTTAGKAARAIAAAVAAPVALAKAAKTVASKAVSRKAAPAKPAPAAKAVRKAVKEPISATVPASVIPSYDDIALRAYFIAEKRRAEGRHAEPHEDWIEAERQLRAELQTNGAARPSRKKK
jgi:hypothetical protein